MSRDQAIGAIWIVGALTLVFGALARRRLPPARLARLALLWAAIFAGGYAIVTLIGAR